MRKTLVSGILCIFVIVVALCANAQLVDSPANITAHANEQQLPIGDEKLKKSEDNVDLKDVDKQLFKRLFIKRRKEHLEAVKNLQNIKSYERQYKMINILVEKMFDVIESKKVILENLTESELNGMSFATDTQRNNDIKDASSSVLENIALFGDIVLNLPDITHRILKTKQPKWNSTIDWSFEFLNRTKNWLDKSTLQMINLLLQELNITKREPDYFNPNAMANSGTSSKNVNTKKSSTKKEKPKRGPTMTKIDL